MAEYKLISADSHVNEVSATWERVRRKYGDRAPEIVWNPSEDEHGPYLSIRDWETSLEGKNRESCAMEFLGMVIGGLGVGSVVGRTSSKAAEFRKNFRFEDWPGPWEPNARLRDMDRDGVEVDILYASHLRHVYGLSVKDEPFFRAIAHSYNDWLMEYCSVAPNRLVGLPVLSILNIEGAVEDLTHYAKQGAKGFMIASSTPIGMNYGEANFDRLWAAAQDADVPLVPSHDDRRLEKSKISPSEDSHLHPRRRRNSNISPGDDLRRRFRPIPALENCRCRVGHRLGRSHGRQAQGPRSEDWTEAGARGLLSQEHLVHVRERPGWSFDDPTLWRRPVLVGKRLSAWRYNVAGLSTDCGSTVRGHFGRDET